MKYEEPVWLPEVRLWALDLDVRLWASDSKETGGGPVNSTLFANALVGDSERAGVFGDGRARRRC